MTSGIGCLEPNSQKRESHKTLLAIELHLQGAVYLEEPVLTLGLSTTTKPAALYLFSLLLREETYFKGQENNNHRLLPYTWCR